MSYYMYLRREMVRLGDATIGARFFLKTVGADCKTYNLDTGDATGRESIYSVGGLQSFHPHNGVRSDRSTYMTDESSHNSSINNSPVSNKVRKRSHATLDSCNNFCFPVRDDLQHVPLKTTKVELIKTPMPTKVYKLTKDIKSEPIYINGVTIRHGESSSTPYVVQTLPGGVRTVNIRPQKNKLLDKLMIGSTLEADKDGKEALSRTGPFAAAPTSDVRKERTRPFRRREPNHDIQHDLVDDVFQLDVLCDDDPNQSTKTLSNCWLHCRN